MDYAVLDPLHAFGVKHPAWVRFWDMFCTVFSPEGFRLLGAVAVVVAVLRRNLRVILFLLTTIGLSGVLAQVAKDLVDRPRPVGALAASVSSSFPSGHATAATVGVLALLTISAGTFSHRTRSVTIVLGVTAVLAVSFGRVAVNVHYPSDVVAGWALGYLWYLGWLLVIRPVSLARAAVPDKTPRALNAG
jgi:membrane-associated phospholipid phosphatase